MYHAVVNTAKKANIDKLLRTIKAHYKKEGRGHLPWRKTRDPYAILVSEVMLQQTQVVRVIPFYDRWMKKFPTAQSLARAKLSDVLKLWSGLGYNRRAKYLWEAAKIMSAAKILSKKSSAAPRLFSIEFLSALPGVGPYTAAAVRAFAYNEPEVFIETNIRTVFLHFCFSLRSNLGVRVDDKEILPLVAEALKRSKMQPRDFYAALMDYGTFLKQSGVKLNSRSKSYTKQSKFEGSLRQLRGAIMRELLKKPATLGEIKQKLPRAVRPGELEVVLAQLVREGMAMRRGTRYRIR